LATDGNGVASTVFATLKAGVWKASATVAAGTVAGSPVGLVFEPAGDPGGVLKVTQGTVLADGVHKHAAWVIVTDVNGNPMSGVMVDFAVTEGSEVPGPTLSAPWAVSCDFWSTDPSKPAWCDAPGKALVEITSEEPDTFYVSASIDGVAVTDSPKPVSFNTGAVDP
jgi:hypothetical protein